MLIKLIIREITLTSKENGGMSASFLFSFMNIAILAYLGDNFKSLSVLSFVSCFIMYLNATLMTSYIFEKEIANGVIEQLFFFGASKEKIFFAKFINHQIFCILPCLIQILFIFYYYQPVHMEKYIIILFLFGVNLSAITMFVASISTTSSNMILSLIISMPLIFASNVIAVLILENINTQFHMIKALVGISLINLSLSFMTSNILMDEFFMDSK
jgi:ABC-type transport system involved in cytochrome c biogenesis permease component